MLQRFDTDIKTRPFQHTKLEPGVSSVCETKRRIRFVSYYPQLLPTLAEIISPVDEMTPPRTLFHPGTPLTP